MVRYSYFLFVVALMITALSVAPTAAEARGDRLDEDDLEAVLEGTLYLKMDAPCATGRHPYGVYKRPLVEVSPDGANTDADGVEINASWWHADSTYWGLRVNDPVELDEVDIERGEARMDIELEGIGPADGAETVIEFVDIHTMEDFMAAVERTFSREPLQNAHDDWSDEIKQAIADRELREGMNKRQAFYVTGTPKRFEKRTENGQDVEIWYLRQDRGVKMGYFTSKAGESTGLPESIRFVDGALVDLVSAGDSSQFSLDD